MSPALVILAAGAGSRYGGLKQLAAVGPNGETLLEYSAFDAVRAGFDRIVLVIRPETESMFRERLDSHLATRVPVDYVHQSLEIDHAGFANRAKPWGTGHAVLAVAAVIDGPFAVINADDFYGARSYVNLSRFLVETQEGNRLAAVGFSVAETLSEAGAVSRAVLEIDGRDRLRNIVEFTEVWRKHGRVLCRDGEGKVHTLRGKQLVSMNMWGLTPELLPELRRRFADFVTLCGDDPDSELLLPEVIQELVGEGLFEVEILAGSGDWCGMTYRQDEERMRSTLFSMVAEGRYPDKLWAVEETS